MANNLDASTDSRVDIHRRSRRCQSCQSCASAKFNNQTLGRATLDPQTTVRIKIVGRNLSLNNVNNIGIVPNTLGRQCLPPNHHPIDRISGESVSIYERTLIFRVIKCSSQQIRLPTRVINQIRSKGIHINTNSGSIIVIDAIIDQHRLRTTNKKGCCGIGSSANSCCRIRAFVSSRIVFQPRIRHAEIRLMHFDRIEGCKSSFNSRCSASVRQTIVVQRSSSAVADENPTPVARQWCSSSSRVRRIKRTAKSVTIVVETGHHDWQCRGSLSDERAAVTKLDTRAPHL